MELYMSIDGPETLGPQTGASWADARRACPGSPAPGSPSGPCSPRSPFSPAQQTPAARPASPGSRPSSAQALQPCLITRPSSAMARQPSGPASPTPKRVSFADPPPALRHIASAAASLDVGLDGAGRAGVPAHVPTAALSPLRRVAAAASLLAADHSLTHIPSVDSPRRRTPPPHSDSAVCRRWPSNEGLRKSDEEISAQVDMSDLPFGVHTPRSTDAPLARAFFFNLLPVTSEAGSQGQEASAAAAVPAEAQQEGEQQEAEVGVRATRVTPEPSGAPQQTQPPASLACRLACLLARLLSAAATSGSSIAELAADSSGAPLVLGSGSRSSSMLSLASARSSGSSTDLDLHSACSTLDELEWVCTQSELLAGLRE